MILYPYICITTIDPANQEALPHTELVRYDQFVQNLIKPQSEELMKLHCALGVCGEAGELADAIKRECIYGKAPDRTNIVEELGDLQWYIQGVMLQYKISPDEVFQHNADKLAKRYVGLTYTDRAAIERVDKVEENGKKN